LLDQPDDGFEAALIGNGKRSFDSEAKLRQADNIGEVEIFERLIIRDIEKD